MMALDELILTGHALYGLIAIPFHEQTVAQFFVLKYRVYEHVFRSIQRYWG